MSQEDFTLNSGPMDPATKEQAELELRETDEIVKQGLEELRALLLEDDTLHFYYDDDDFLMIFLRPCKFYAKSAFELIKRIADFKDKNAVLVKDLMPEDEKEAFTKSTVVNVLKERDHKGRRVLVVNCGESWDPSKVNADQLFRLFYLIHEAAVVELETQVKGVVVIMDYKGMGMKQVTGLTPAFCIRLINFIQDAMPLRLKEVHIVKQPFIFGIVWQMIKPFIREKLKSRLTFHGNKMSSLHKFIPPTHLPTDYGGQLPEIDYSGEQWFGSLEGHLEHIQKMNSCGRRKAKENEAK